MKAVAKGLELDPSTLLTTHGREDGGGCDKLATLASSTIVIVKKRNDVRLTFAGRNLTVLSLAADFSKASNAIGSA